MDLRIRKKKLGPRLRGGDILLALVCAFGLAACAQPGSQQLKPRLEAADSGTVWFATPGRINRDPKTGRFSQSKEPVVLSGDLYFPEGKGPFPVAVVVPRGRTQRSNSCGVTQVDSQWT